MHIIFIVLTFLYVVLLFVTLIKPNSIKQIREGKTTRKKMLRNSIIGIFVLLIFVGITAPQHNAVSVPTPSTAAVVASATTAMPSATSITPDDLPTWIAASLKTLASSGTLSASQASEISAIPPLTIQDEWNQSWSFSENLSPATPTTLSDFQVTAILDAIQALRKQRSDQYFNVIVFDDPTIAKENRTADFADLPDAQYCKIFIHFRGNYDWNPTTENEDLSLGSNCTWEPVTGAAPAVPVSAAPAAKKETLAPVTSAAPATLTDSGYIQDFENNVMPLIEAVGSDVMSGNAELADSNVANDKGDLSASTSDISSALSDYQQGQTDLASAQTALTALQGKTPADMANIQGLAGKYLDSEAQVFVLFIGDINSHTTTSSGTLNAYTQMNRSNLYQGQMNGAIQDWQSANL